MFRYKKSASSVSYNRQGYIYFYSLLYNELDDAGQEYIRKIAKQAGGEYADAVLDYVTTDDGETKVCREHNIERATLFRAVARYYEMF